MLRMGALNKVSKIYTPPLLASKKDTFTCPECERDVILKKGKIKRVHFSHCKEESPCNYFEHPNESQIHKSAKLHLEYVLKEKTLLSIKRKCMCCWKESIIDLDKSFDDFKLEHRLESFQRNEDFSDNLDKSFDDVKLKHRLESLQGIEDFSDNLEKRVGTKVADVACLQNSDIIYIFEVFYTHRTEEGDRPEPWFELEAREILNDNFECKRLVNCKDCVEKTGNITTKICSKCDGFGIHDGLPPRVCMFCTCCGSKGGRGEMCASCKSKQNICDQVKELLDLSSQKSKVLKLLNKRHTLPMLWTDSMFEEVKNKFL